MKFAIVAEIISIDSKGEQLRYNFKVSPLIADSPVFTFTMFVDEKDRTKCVRGVDYSQSNSTVLLARVMDAKRRIIARELRTRHTATWQRYHRWLEMTGELTRERDGPRSKSRPAR